MAAVHCGMAAFEEQVYEVVRSVPPGRVTTYGTIARVVGYVRAARRVGWAMHHCPDDVPAHRVVNAEGRLSGGWAFGAPEIQRALLEAEGVRFVGAERCDLEAHRWPSDSELAQLDLSDP